MQSNHLIHFSPEKLLDPASLRDSDRRRLTLGLEAMGICRVSVQHAWSRQTLRKIGDEWVITCSNAKY
ncbi:hypothetical protein PGB28_17145 [Primorskyibacter aestuariivivens]|uniref:hypothetical protein n=1 Tax=Primorskyibacter aestuariivivens TaxID=1888912 RepID=UPI0023013414|nr:hypothetical protein [Primorskyibacter aestuariivivens]MDA7430192.1 hypothetical protein [Primorskyibacter aestuariivivens]